MSSIDSPPIRVKFDLMRTVVSIHRELFTSFRRGIKHASWKTFCDTLFGFNSPKLKWSKVWSKAVHKGGDDDLVYPYRPGVAFLTRISRNGHFTETKSIVPEPVLSYRLANVAISCMQYLHRLDFNTLPTHYHFLASWATKSKQLPWLWRRRIRVTSMRLGRRRPIWNHNGHKCTFPQKFRRPWIIYSETIQSHQELRLFHIWTLDLLYHTLRKATKSDLLIRALSKPFIPTLVPILFPRHVMRVRKAAATYLEKVSRRASYLGR